MNEYAVEALVGCEPAFMRAGSLARELQGTVAVETKSSTGHRQTDVVTAADRRVQREVLQALLAAGLEGCRLLAEEEEAAQAPEEERLSELMGRFDPEGALYLSLDPIDGTSRYADGEPYYSLIVGLHDGRRPLYTFVYYPSLDWWLRLSAQGVSMAGPPPRLSTDQDLSRVLVYTMGDPVRELPELAEALEKRGYLFRQGDQIGPCGSKFLVLSGQVGGYYASQPNLYDGLFGLHYGLAQGRPIRSTVDLGRRQSTRRGWCYPGYYLVLPPGLQDV